MIPSTTVVQVLILIQFLKIKNRWRKIFQVSFTTEEEEVQRDDVNKEANKQTEMKEDEEKCNNKEPAKSTVHKLI